MNDIMKELFMVKVESEVAVGLATAFLFKKPIFLMNTYSNVCAISRIVVRNVQKNWSSFLKSQQLVG